MPKAESLVDAIANSLPDINVNTLGDELVHVEAEELFVTMVYGLELLQ